MKIIAWLALIVGVAIAIFATSCSAEYFRTPKGSAIHAAVSSHSGTKAQFLDWLKARNASFGDVAVSEQDRQNLKEFAYNFWQAGGKSSDIQNATSMIDVSFEIRTDHWPFGRWLRYWIFYDNRGQQVFSKSDESYQFL